MVLSNQFSPSFFLIILSACFASCQLRAYRHLEPTAQRYSESPTLLNDSYKTYVFKSKMTYKENTFSGLFVVKHEGEGTKIALVPQMGPKLFDFELTPGNEFRVHHCLQQLNRPIILKMIEQDIRLLLQQPKSIKKTTFLQNPLNNFLVKRLKTNKSVNYYFFDPKTGNLAALESANSLGRKKTVIQLSDFSNGFPNKIDLIHQNIPLSLSFTTINRKLE